ncbi:MAG: TrkA family potassium uptake protein [Myxococcales bacterium]|nr:TrkA family potassium uptake protein [Myxococcales bacterium]
MHLRERLSGARKPRYIVLTGAGVLGFAVARSLVEHGHDVVVIDRESAVCDHVYAELGATVLCGDATDIHVLEEAGVRRADLVLALMHRDPDNIACALLARTLGVARVIARMRDAEYEASYRAAGVSHLVRATAVLRNQILTHIEHPKISDLLSLRGERVHIFSLTVPETAAVVDTDVRAIAAMAGFPRKSLLLGRIPAVGDGLVILRGGDRLAAGDTILAIADADDLDALTDVLTRPR